MIEMTIDWTQTNVTWTYNCGQRSQGVKLHLSDSCGIGTVRSGIFTLNKQLKLSKSISSKRIALVHLLSTLTYKMKGTKVQTLGAI